LKAPKSHSNQTSTMLRLIKNLLWPVISIFLALAIGGILIWASGRDPVAALHALYDGAFGNKINFSEALIKVVPLLLCGLGVAFAFRCSFFNIGAEGQFYIGALAATWLGVSFQAPSLIMIPIMIAAAFLAGGAWCALAAWLKVKLGCSEVINTIMLNYIAMRLVGYAVNGPLKESGGFLPQSDEIAQAAKLPVIWAGTRLHAGLLIALLSAVFLYWVLFKTVLGYQVRAVGLSHKASDYGGIPSSKRFIQASLISGGFAGIAGAVELMGVTHRLYEVFSPGYGFDAIAVSLLAGNNPIGIIASAFLFGALRAGAGQMQRAANVSSVLVSMIQALVIIFIVFSTSGPKITFKDRAQSRPGEVS
jgi:ABC-type uncharacterized transport system permease subunit